MKILQVIHGFLPQFRGGTELYVRGLCRELRRLGQEVSVVAGTTHSADEPRKEIYDFDGMQVARIVLSGSYLEHWTRSYSPAAARLFAEEVRRVRPDLVHVHHWFRLSRNLLETCYRLGIPAVCTVHDLYPTCPTFFRMKDGDFSEDPLDFEHWGAALPRLPWMGDAEVADEIDRFREDFDNELALAHRIVVPSRAHGALLERLVNLPEDRLVVLPHGTIAPPAPAGRAAPAPGERIRLGIWGHLFHMKGAHVLLEALQGLEERDRFTVHVWGRVVEPKYRERLDRASEGLEVVWHGGFVPEDVAAEPLDLAVMPSLCSESFSFVLDEAFRLGLPVLASRRGALAERVGGAGAVFEPGSSEELGRLLRKVAADPEVLERWRAGIPELTPMADHAKEMLDLYAGVVRRREMGRLQPDMDLVARRPETLVRRLMDREATMFAYLGRIKREAGRGDHYEGVVKEMIEEQHRVGRRLGEAESELAGLRRVAAERARLIEILGREVADLRGAVLRGLDGDVRDLAPKPPHIEEHIPGLGPIEAVVRENQAALDRFRARVADDPRFGGSRRMVAFLAGEILAFRAAIAAGLEGRLEIEIEAAELPDDGVHVPLLGAADEVAAADTEAIRALLERFADQRADEDAAFDLLAREMDAFAEALAEVGSGRLGDPPAVRSVLEREGIESAPGFARAEPYLRGHPEVFEGFRKRLVEHREHQRKVESALEAQDRAGLRGIGLRLKHEKRLLDLRRERDEMLRRLSVLVEDLHRALGLVHAESPEFHASPAPRPMEGVDLPRLGDLPTLHETGRRLGQQQAAVLRELRLRLGEMEARAGRRETVIQALAGEIERLRQALHLVFDPGRAIAEPEAVAADEVVEGLGDLNTVRRIDDETIARHRQGLDGRS